MIKFSILSLLIILFGCEAPPVDISSYEIVSLKIKEAKDLEKNGIGPGQTKTVTFIAKIKDKDGTIVEVPEIDPDSLRLDASYGLSIKSVYGSTFELTASYNNQQYWNKNLLLSYQVKKNDYKVKLLTMPVNYNRTRPFVFSGAEKDAPHARIYTAVVKSSDNQSVRLFKILVSDEKVPTLLITPEGTSISFTSQGKDGADGSNGSSCNDGSNGGSGGNGGNIYFYTQEFDDLTNIEAKSVGGRGGEGGRGGSSQDEDDIGGECSSGRNGNNGSNGAAGKVSYLEIDIETIKQEFIESGLTEFIW